MVDLWSGFGGLPQALLQCGWHFYCLSAEWDAEATKVAKQTMPDIVHIDRVEMVTVDTLLPWIRRRRPRGILMGGGSPCQGNSALNKDRMGLHDERSLQPIHLCKLRDEVAAHPECSHLLVLALLENVASMPAEVLVQYNQWLGASPIMIDAAPCGWVHRRRYYWLVAHKAAIGPHLQAPDSWDWVPHNGSVTELRWQGSKPLPSKVVLQQGFTFMMDPGEVLAKAGVGAMHTFTREFFHPTDRVRQATPAAAARFFEDDRRFPPAAYEEPSLVWKGSQWRQLLPEERAQIMGVPPGTFQSLQGPQTLRRQRANSLLGNGFHVFSVVALLSMIPQILATKMPAPWIAADEGALRERCRHTVWEPGCIDSFPDLLSTREVVQGIQECFPTCAVPDQVWELITVRLSSCPLRDLQMFTAWCRKKQLPWDVLGPTPIDRMARALIYSGLSGQRHPADSTKGLDHLLPPGLGRGGHVAQSLQLPSPFNIKPWPDLDAQFVIETIAVWQVFLPQWASRQRKGLKSVALALQPLEEALDAFRVESSRKVAHLKKPAFAACMTTLLRWPDRLQPEQLVKGYPIVGEFAESGVFRKIGAKEGLTMNEWLADAPTAIAKLMASRPPRFSEAILKTTQEEQAKGFCSPFFTKEEMDGQFGCGQWRPLERFIITQPCGKQRVIDNARKTEHNAATTLHETIYTVHLDFIASMAADLSNKLHLLQPPMECPEVDWLSLRLGTDDLPDAYRALPVRPDHQGYSVVAVFVHGAGWRFTKLYGLAFGLESAVVSFNRWPQLAIAISRRCACSLSAAYFDDEMCLEPLLFADPSQQGLRLVLRLLGSEPQKAKGFRPAADRHYLGASVHLGNFASRGVIRFQPKFTTTQKVLAKIHHALQTNQLDRDSAGKLRGDLQWMYSQCAGHLGRLAGQVFTAHQGDSDPALTPLEARLLRLLCTLVQDFSPRDIPVVGQLPLPIVVYSDASFENGVLRLGWVIFAPNCTPLGGTTVVPHQVVSSWKGRSQQIFPGETLCALVLPLLYPTTLESHDLLWFVDNEAAVSTLIRGTTSELDVHLIAQCSLVRLARLGCRLWLEWIDSESNPSDGLSRAGLDDERTQQQGWSLMEFDFPQGLDHASLLEWLETLSSQGDSGC